MRKLKEAKQRVQVKSTWEVAYEDSRGSVLGFPIKYEIS